MTEVDKLNKRLEGSRNFNVFWGPEAHTYTLEEKAKAINDVLDQADARHSLPKEEQMLLDMRVVYDHLKQAIKMTKIDFASEDALAELENRDPKMSKIFGHLDMSLLHLSNWVKGQD